MVKESNKSLEERARKLLRWKITKKGKSPNPFTETAELAEEIQFLINKGYIIDNNTNNAKSSYLLGYYITPKGRKYALNKQ